MMIIMIIMITQSKRQANAMQFSLELETRMP